MESKITETGDALVNEVSDIYTPLSEAKEEIWRRWNDDGLKKKVEDFLGGDVPEFLKGKPKAYLARNIASPNFEFLHFLELAKESGLEAVVPEYRSDKFVSLSEDKYYLGKVFIYEGNGKNGGQKVISESVVDFNSEEGKKFNEVRTFQGESLVDFHHKMIELLSVGFEKNIFDISDWIARNGVTPDKFYLNFLALFVCNSILFENFLKKDDSDRKFIREVVIPNFKKIEQIFGIKPLIIAIAPIETENDPYWWYYPKKIETILK